jgi:putative transposase
MRDFKGATRYAYMKRFRRVLWQKSYYDHACRRGEDLTAAARYIVRNPVRSGLVDNAADYPFNGSFVLARGALMEG